MKANKAADMLTKIKRLYERARSRVVSLCVVDVLELRDKIDPPTDEMEAKHLELKTMSVIVVETSMLREETAKLREVATKGEANVVVFVGLQEEVFAAKKTIVIYSRLQRSLKMCG